jgi:hypothetical protein
MSVIQTDAITGSNVPHDYAILLQGALSVSCCLLRYGHNVADSTAP